MQRGGRCRCAVSGRTEWRGCAGGFSNGVQEVWSVKTYNVAIMSADDLCRAQYMVCDTQQLS